MRYLIRLKFKKQGIVGNVFAQVINYFTSLANTIFNVIKPITERFGYKLLKVDFYCEGNKCYLDVVVEKIKSPQIIALILEILEAITPILSRLGLVFLSYSLYEYAQAVKKQAEAKEIESKTVYEVVETAKKTNPKAVTKIAKIIPEVTQTEVTQRHESKSPLSNITQILNLIAIIMLLVAVVMPLTRVIFNVIGRRFA